MKKSILTFALVCLIAPASLFAQETRTSVTKSEDDKTYTITEETDTDNGVLVTTTVYQKDSVVTNGFWKNWTLGGALGAQLYYGENDWKVNNWKEMITFPAFDFYLTKWVSPNFGVGLGLSGFKFKGLYQEKEVGSANDNPHFITGDAYDSDNSSYNYQGLSYQRAGYGNAYVLAHADLGNILFGYKPDRFFDIDAYAGGGLILGQGKKDEYMSHGATFNLGLNNTFRLTDKVRLMLNIRGALVSDEFDGESYIDEPDLEHVKANHQYDGNFGATLGLQISLTKGQQWQYVSRTSQYKETSSLDKIALEAKEAEAEKLASDLAAAKDANDKLQKEFTELTKVQYITEIPDLWLYINFTINKWDIAKREIVNLQSFASLINSSPNSKFLITGYADKQTASAQHNLMLSENRVNAVYNMLVNDFGVDPAKLETDYKGGVDTMFLNDSELSRCVVINLIK